LQAIVIIGFLTKRKFNDLAMDCEIQYSAETDFNIILLINSKLLDSFQHVRGETNF
jgi:hypothetical protein